MPNSQIGLLCQLLCQLQKASHRLDDSALLGEASKELGNNEVLAIFSLEAALVSQWQSKAGQATHCQAKAPSRQFGRPWLQIVAVASNIVCSFHQTNEDLDGDDPET